MNKLGFLSLEYIVGDQTYWLQSAFDPITPDYRFCFRVIPLSSFAGYPIVANHIIEEADYSEITPVEKDGKTAYLFAFSQHSNAIWFDIDIKAYPKLGWNETFEALVLAGVPLADLQGFWHNHLVQRAIGAPEWVKPDLNYLVTAWLPNESLFAVRGEDYKPPENPNWVTVKCEPDTFVERLKWFRVHAIRFSTKANEYHLV